MAHGLSLILRDIQPRDRMFLPMDGSYRSRNRVKHRPLNACKVPVPERRRSRRRSSVVASASRIANRSR